MRILWILPYAALAAALLSGCAGDDPNVAAADPNARLASAPLAPAEDAGRQVVRTADLVLRVDRLQESESYVSELVNRAGGYVEATESNNLDEANPRVDLTLRIPVARFESVLAELEQRGQRLVKRIRSEDVTAQFADVDARLRVMRAQEESYLRSLRNLPVQSTVQLQDRLMGLRSEIESIEARRRALANRSAMATIQLRLVREATPGAWSNDPDWARESLGASLQALGAVGRALGSMAIFFAVFSPFWAPVVWFVWRAIRRSKSAQPTSAPA